MFKFKIIEYNKQNQNTAQSTSNTMNVMHEQNVILDESEDATILVTDIKEKKTIGSFSLVKRKLNHLAVELSSLIPTELVNQKGFWEGSQLTGPEIPEDFFRYFYRTLYDGIVEFGNQKSVGFIVVKLTVALYPVTKEIGLWPYILEFSPKVPSDDFFYGVLPLKGFLYGEYQERWKKIDKIAQENPALNDAAIRELLFVLEEKERGEG